MRCNKSSGMRSSLSRQRTCSRVCVSPSRQSEHASLFFLLLNTMASEELKTSCFRLLFLLLLHQFFPFMLLHFVNGNGSHVQSGTLHRSILFTCKSVSLPFRNINIFHIALISSHIFPFRRGETFKFLSFLAFFVCEEHTNTFAKDDCIRLSDF